MHDVRIFDKGKTIWGCRQCNERWEERTGQQRARTGQKLWNNIGSSCCTRTLRTTEQMHEPRTSNEHRLWNYRVELQRGNRRTHIEPQQRTDSTTVGKLRNNNPDSENNDKPQQHRIAQLKSPFERTNAPQTRQRLNKREWPRQQALGGTRESNNI